jgi:ankyrin repeat protein
MSHSVEFFHAAEAGLVDRVRQLLTEHPELLDARDADGATVLHHAAFHGHRELVQLLVASGADLNARDGQHHATPTGWAIHYLRELGGLLAIEIEDVLYAIERHDAAWVHRLVRRHPALMDAVDRTGKPLAVHARESGVEAIAEVFAQSVGGESP